MKLPTQYMLPVPRETISVDGREWEVVTAGERGDTLVVTVKPQGPGGNLHYLELDLETMEPKGSPRKLDIEMLEHQDALSELLRGLRGDLGLEETRGTQRALFGSYSSREAASKAPKRAGRAAPARGKAGEASGSPKKPDRGAEIARTILDQMGGKHRIVAMTGAKHFTRGKNWVSFQFPNRMRSKPNYVKITLNGRDLYDIEFGRVGNKSEDYGGIKIKSPVYKKLLTKKDYYFDMLIDLFEKTTGLYLRL